MRERHIAFLATPKESAKEYTRRQWCQYGQSPGHQDREDVGDDNGSYASWSPQKENASTSHTKHFRSSSEVAERWAVCNW